MKRFTKLFSVLLALLMVVSVFASCTNDEPQESKPQATSPTTTPAATTPSQSSNNPEATTPTPESSKADLENMLPPKMELDKDMAVLVGDLYYDEWLAADDGDIVGTELYGRVLRVEDRLGIELDFEQYKGTDRAVAMEEVKKRQESTDPNLIVEAVSTYSQYAGTLTLEGRYQNMNNSDNINFDNPWWPADLMVNSIIDDKLYFVSGDISPTLIYETYAIFYNLELVEKYNIGNPIDLVNDYEWTLDKLIEVTTDIYEDTDTTITGPNVGDFFAFNFNDGAHNKALPFAMGIRVIEPDEDDGYAWSELYTGQRMETICDKVGAWVLNNPGVRSQDETGYGDYGVSFKNGLCIFNLGNFAYASHYLQGMGVDYGVVPCPLFDGDQEQYYSYYGNPTSFWGVPTNADIDDACALVEYLAADAYVYISPALFERALKFKYITGEVDGLSKMFDIIRDGLVFDACMFYNEKIGGAYNQFTNITSGLSSWSAQFVGFKTAAMKTSLKTVVTKLRDLQY